jgi:hypothetical protein
MGEITEIQVGKGLTRQTSEKEWLKLEYSLKANARARILKCQSTGKT